METKILSSDIRFIVNKHGYFKEEINQTQTLTFSVKFFSYL